MSAGLYPKSTVAKWLGKRPQDIDDLITNHGLPAVPVPSEQGMRDKIALHGLHGWLAKQNKGGRFMTPEQLMWELDRCEAGPVPGAAEIPLLTELEQLSASVREALRQGLEPKHTRAALMAVMMEYQTQAEKEVA
jgi:hypothetical protein